MANFADLLMLESLLSSEFCTSHTGSQCCSPGLSSYCCTLTDGWNLLEEGLSVGPIPMYNLDYARTIELFDFYTNGVEHELDEYDLCQIGLRRLPSKRSTVELSFPLSRENHLQFKRMNCVFCRNNGEPLSVYGSHILKDCQGRVTCPILRRYTCPICGCSGDNAHTIKYCPMNVNNMSRQQRR